MKPITHIPDDEIEEWGNDRIETLLSHYGEKQSQEWKTEEGEKKVSESGPLIDPDSARREWTELKKEVKKEGYSRYSMVELYSQIADFHADKYPMMLQLARFAITLPVHTADVERSFSNQNLISTPLRNALTPEHQDMLMRVKMEGPDTPDLERWIVRVIDQWAAAKKRMLLTKAHSK